MRVSDFYPSSGRRNRPPIHGAPEGGMQTHPGTADYDPQAVQYTDTPIDPRSGSGTVIRNGAEWVSHVWQAGVDEGAPAVIGPPNDQLFQSGHTSIVPVNPTAEQGYGRPPGWGRHGHYPHDQQFNATITAETFMLDGQPGALISNDTADSERGRPLRSPIWPEGYGNYRQQPDQKHVWPVTPVANQAPNVPFTQNVPDLAQGGGLW